jgi:hypothetical protein
MADIISFYDLWVGILANLTFKFSEVVTDGNLVLLYDHLGLNPAF